MRRRHPSLTDRARWNRVRRAVLDRDNWRCQACGRPGGPFEVDHIRPVRWGGDPWNMDNLQTLCAVPCHRDKSARENRRRRRTAGERAWRAMVDELL